MRRQKILGLTALTATAFALSHDISGAQAQTQSQAAQPAPDASAGLARQVSLTPQEQLAQADAIVTRMDHARATVRQELEKARTMRDVVKTLCLNDKMNQLDVAVRSARERRDALGAAALRNDGDLSSHEFTILSVLRQRGDQLSAEANQCIGSGDVTTDTGSAVTHSIEPGIAPEEPGGGSISQIIVPEPPTCSSCVK